MLVNPSRLRLVSIGNPLWWIARKAWFATVVVLFLVRSPASEVTNDWTKADSGDWQEAYWSSGSLPGLDQDWVAFRNAGWKALAIDGNTSANYPAALALNNLLVDAPLDSFNQLLLNWAGFSVPLDVRSNLIVGTNGSLASHYSSLRAANGDIFGTATFSDYAVEDFGALWLRSGASLKLSNGSMTCSNLTFGSATLTQSGGTHLVESIKLPVVGNPYAERVSGSYLLQAGGLVSQWLDLGYAVGPFGNGDGHGTFRQTGGVHTNSEITLQAYYRPSGGSTFAGSYILDAGVLVSNSVTNDGGYFGQNGGTNLIQEVFVRGGSRFVLQDGELVTSNTTDYVDTYVGGTFVQGGGKHTVLGRLRVLGGGYSNHRPEYSLSGGVLVTDKIELQGILEFSSHGILTNRGTLLLSGGTLVANDSAETQQLGQLECGGGLLDMHGYGPFTNATVWRFSDSSNLPWTGSLTVNSWGFNPGDHIFFGTNTQGLTAAQLDRVRFLGYNYSTNPAALLPTGELVPVLGTNEWTKPTSGNWEESYWSLGRLPGLDQNLVVFSNGGVKDLIIGPNTAAQHPGSLSVYNLGIYSPPSASNRLVLNRAGLDVPLSVHWNLTVGTNSALVSEHSALQAASTYIHGSVSFSDGSVASLNDIWLGPRAVLTSADASINSSHLDIHGATISQSAGTHLAQTINLPAYDYREFYDGVAPRSFYYLTGGSLVSQNLLLDSNYDTHGAVTFGTFVQSGGVHTNSNLTLWNRSNGSAKGSYILNGGLLVSGFVDCSGGSFTQNGGTNNVGELRGSGDFALNGGSLIASNASVYSSRFAQAGGTHITTGLLSIGSGSGDPDQIIYDLRGGTLVTSNIDLWTGTLRMSTQGVVSNTGVFRFSCYFPGAIRAHNVGAVQHLGRLQLSYGGTLDLHFIPDQATNATVLHFLDSHALPWSGNLQITNWGLHSGDHIFFGTDSQALTEAQLLKIRFTGTNTDSPAKLLNSGELVPARPPPLFARKLDAAIILSWAGGGYQLLTATNLTGPYLPIVGATSPVTNALAGSERYFRLRNAP